MDATLVTWSIAFGGFFGAVATNRIGRPVTRFCKYGGSLAMGLAIVTTHFTAMAAMTVVPMGGITIPPQALSDSFMMSGVVIAIGFIMIMASSAYIIDLHSAKEASDSYQRLALQDPLTGRRTGIIWRSGCTRRWPPTPTTLRVSRCWRSTSTA